MIITKLEIEHIIPYLPYGLWVMIDDVMCEVEGVDLDSKDTIIVERVNYKLTDIKPCLIPLEDFEKIEEIVDEFSDNTLAVFKENFFGFGSHVILNRFDYVDYNVMLMMFKWHVDIFQLIDLGLVIKKVDKPMINL